VAGALLELALAASFAMKARRMVVRASEHEELRSRRGLIVLEFGLLSLGWCALAGVSIAYAADASEGIAALCVVVAACAFGFSLIGFLVPGIRNTLRDPRLRQ